MFNNHAEELFPLAAVPNTIIEGMRLNARPCKAVDGSHDDRNSRAIALKAAYTQLLKENRDTASNHLPQVDSAFLNAQISTRELVRDLISGGLYRDWIFTNNSPYRFVELCFERVLGRPASRQESMRWASKLSVEGLNAFAEALTSTDEYLKAFGKDRVPARRCDGIPSSSMGLASLSFKTFMVRYPQVNGGLGMAGGGRGFAGSRQPTSAPAYSGSMPPALATRVWYGLAIIGGFELGRVVLSVALDMLSTN